MKLTILDDSPGVLRFRIDETSVNFVNAIRRIATNSIKSIAIDSITFYENSWKAYIK